MRSIRRWWRRRQFPTTPHTVFDSTLRSEGYAEYAAVVRSVLVCPVCGWSWAYHVHDVCPTESEQDEIVTRMTQSS